MTMHAPAFVLRCQINGKEEKLTVAPARRLIDILREDLQLTGTKISCEMGRCGSCMVHINGKPYNACLTMAYQCSGKRIVTIEGVGAEEKDPIQCAFLEEGGFQCGYCTPGMIMSVMGLLEEYPNPSREQIEEGLSGNLCRCTGYGGIYRSVERAIQKRSLLDKENA
ncbi:(2Fe-2S)-binding protein [Paenibacillus rigui]|uniref:Xanthine dehydrogenase subunit E n=1 Tax=Paenibacillus rigui TaxID=554312 RepID=A0A229UXU4_9BACL|nr:(2Fe-2S)-binding protein [Paenibacillus rigui]OXM87769.1 xanthine dehydrogenase subunit E [Paenibacillus rigui]